MMLIKNLLAKLSPINQVRIKIAVALVFWGYFIFLGFHYTLIIAFDEIPNSELVPTYLFAGTHFLTAVIVGPVIPFLLKQLDRKKE